MATIDAGIVIPDRDLKTGSAGSWSWFNASVPNGFRRFRASRRRPRGASWKTTTCDMNNAYLLNGVSVCLSGWTSP